MKITASSTEKWDKVKNEIQKTFQILGDSFQIRYKKKGKEIFIENGKVLKL